MIRLWGKRPTGPAEGQPTDDSLTAGRPAPRPDSEPAADGQRSTDDAGTAAAVTDVPAVGPVVVEAEPVVVERKGWFSRLRDSLAGGGEAPPPEEPPSEPEPQAEPAQARLVEPSVPAVEQPAPEVVPEPAVAAPPPVTQPVPAPVAGPAMPPVVAEPAPARKGWLSRLRDGLAKSTSKLTDGISGIFTRKKLDDDTLEELEDLLITADLGPATAARVTAELRRTRFGKEVSPEEVRATLAASVAEILTPVARPLVIDPAVRPYVILMVGVNGTGKTTTIGKFAQQFRAEGRSVMLAAGDTFRAAAVQQLQIWGERTGCPVVARDTGADAAGLAYDALEKARADGVDVLLIDTAGRLQNKAGLMAELQKVVRVIKKVDPAAPHATLLTLDATTGQNAHSQVEVFRDMVQISGLILTKLDGSARGGVLVALADKFKLPVHAIGVGEGADDLRPFEATAFARSLVGLD